jgi:hypothetical protein
MIVPICRRFELVRIAHFGAARASNTITRRPQRELQAAEKTFAVLSVALCEAAVLLLSPIFS